MPATEQTWRDQKRLHFIFGVTGVGLLISTFWMFAVDHQRPWKKTQETSRQIEIATTRWRELQFETNEFQSQQKELAKRLAIESAKAIPAALVNEFKNEVNKDAQSRDENDYDFNQIDRLRMQLDGSETELGLAEDARAKRTEAEEKRAAREQLRQEADQAAAAAQAAKNAAAGAAPAELEAKQAQVTAAENRHRELAVKIPQALTDFQTAEAAASEAESAAQAVRTQLLDRLRSILKAAKFREDRLLGQRKFQAADRDKAVADLGLAVRDERSAETEAVLQKDVDRIVERLNRLTIDYQAAERHRKDLEKILDQATAEQVAAQKEFDKHLESRKNLEKTLIDRRSTYFVSRPPWLGKKWLELPILDAFNSPLKIDNRWSEGLTIDYNFRKIRRYDRCTTCHQAIDKTAPGSATEPAYLRGHEVTLYLIAPESDALPQPREDELGNPLPYTLEQVYGFRLAAEGVLDPYDVTISYVANDSPAAKAVLQSNVISSSRSGEAIVDGVFGHSAPRDPHQTASQPGLMLGDVVLSINGDKVGEKTLDAKRTGARLLDLAGSGEPIEIVVRRGLPNPYASHPRLDLFLGSLSPHKLSDFACSICHDGQGSATAFKWASHSPNTPGQRREWQDEHGWFDNHHWIYPMYPQRFVESACIKCHHEVVDLEPSPKYPDPPAPKVVRGYNLVRKYGCFGCHEINGYDGPHKRVGPDLRLEPNVFAAAQSLKSESGFERLDPDGQTLINQLIYHPEDDKSRRDIYELLQADKAAAKADKAPLFSEYAHEKLAPLFKDVESPGTQQKVGPALRFLSHKLDFAFIYDWIRQPSRFRPSTRMPQFFGQYYHLPQGEEADSPRAIARRYEAVEIHAMTTYLLEKSQNFTYLERPDWSYPPANDADAAAAQVARGKEAFQVRGCLACHTHRDFPRAKAMNSPQYIVQGPDLSAVGDKFNPPQNPVGPQWLYSWLKQPNRYHVRTVMPNLYLDPITHADGKMTDPAADITEFLLSSKTDYQALPGTPTAADQIDPQALTDLAMEFLRDAFYLEAAVKYEKIGVPPEMAPELKGAEKTLVVSREDYAAGKPLSLKQKLLYVGQKALAKHGCYACHDIPGFEDAKPIGTTMADWGRKDTSKLAFEHIAQFLEHQHDEADSADATEAHEDPLPEYFEEALLAGHRSGFLYQKLRQPRSYDYHKTVNKKYNERLRMPKFPFDHEQREAVVTFVLGLVADPPTAKYVYQPDERAAAIIEGRKVLDKYNCGGCHVLESQKWEIAFPPDYFGQQLTETERSKNYPFLATDFPPEEIEESQEIDRRGLAHAVIQGMPTIDGRGNPMVYDFEGDPLEADGSYDPLRLEFPFDLWKPTLLSGHAFEVGVLPLNIPANQIRKKYSSSGGYLAKYLLPHAVAIKKRENPNAKGSEAWGWVPPPLLGQGNKTQAAWLHDFLLAPHPIRPEVLLRMPNFSMTSADASHLVEYFAAVDNADYPHQFSPRRQQDRLAELDASYTETLKQLTTAEQAETRARLSDALRMITYKEGCQTCHIVSDFRDKAAKGPDLSVVYQRLQPNYVRRWIAKPQQILPYTGMPVNIKYERGADNLGTTIPQDIYHGNSVQQLDALVDLLMNFDKFAKRQTRFSELMEKTAEKSATAQAAGNTQP